MNVERLRRAVLALLVVLAVCSSALATDPSLVAHWKFDEGSGSIAYDSADDHDGTVWGGDWTSGILDGALDFDGVDDHLRVADHPTLRFSQYDSFTMSYWAMPAPGEYSSIVGKHRAGGQHGIFGYKSYWSGNSSSFRFTAEESYVGATSITTSADSAPIGNWYHVACVYDNRNMKIYVDGQFISEGTFGYDTGSTTPDHDMVVGARLYDNTMDQYYNGLIDDVRIYDRALTGEEIRQLCREGLGGKASGANPANGAVYVDPQTVLSWEPGEGAVSHDVYFGIDFNDVNDATTSSGEFMDNVDVNSFDPGGLEVGTAYYWRIDEVNGPNTVKGDVWSFTTWVEPNLIAWWTFDEGEGSIGYDSADDHDGRVWGADWTSGILDGALDFDGLDNHVSVPYDPDFQLPVFTVSAWVCLGRDPRPSGSGVIVGRGDDPRSDHQALAFNVGTEGSIWGEGLKLLYEDSGDTERNFATGFFPPVGIWTHVAATRGSNGEVCVYANGGLLDSWASTATPSASCYQDLTIGSHWSNGTMGNFYEGQLDDVRLYNRALAAEEIRQLCREGLGGKAFGGNPANGAVYVDPQTVLSWEPGEGAAWHDVYLGIDFDDVNDADTLSAEFMGNVDVNSFDPRGLELVTTYYWRIDEVNGPNMVKGDIWGFATWVEPNLIAWWKLDEGEGLTAYDSAGNNDGMLTNGPTWTASGINGALSFDDVDDYVEVPDDDYLDISDEITLSAWIRPRNTSVTNDQFIVAKWRIDNSYGMRLEETHPRFFLMAGSSQIAKTYTDLNSAPETWAHMVVTWDGQTMKAYLNGTASDQNEPFSGTINTNDAPIAIGCNLGSAGGIGGAYFDGMIDDVRIYDRALTAEEIEQIYQSASPVNYYYIDGVNGDDLNDGLTLETAFEHIQVGIDAAEDGDTVLVYPDVYVEELDFDGKAITVAGFDEPAVLRAPSFYAVSFFHGEDANSILRNFIIRDSYSGILCLFASPTISNVTVVDCNNGVIADEGSNPIITNSIFWNNTGGGLSGCEAQYSLVQDAITDGLVGHWKFDESSGSIAYDSAANKDGTLTNGPIWRTGIVGGALEFDGVDDYVALPDNNPIWLPENDFSLVGWVYFERPVGGVGETILDLNFAESDSPSNEVGYAIGRNYEPGKLGFHMTTTTNTDERLRSTSSLLEHDWYHVAAVRDGTTQAIYINGELDNSRTCSADPIKFVGGYDDDSVNIGAVMRLGYSAPAGYVMGKLDEFGIYDRGLSAEEVWQVYLEGVGPEFVDADVGDYHLKSEGWRWAGGEVGWTWDELTSRCVDYGNPGTPLRNEPESIPRDPDNIYGANIRVNMGAYGGTGQASMGPHGWALLADLNNDGIVDWLDVGLYAECWLSTDYEPAGDLNRDGTVNMFDWALLLHDWQEATIWR